MSIRDYIDGLKELFGRGDTAAERELDAQAWRETDAAAAERFAALPEWHRRELYDQQMDETAIEPGPMVEDCAPDPVSVYLNEGIDDEPEPEPYEGPYDDGWRIWNE